MTTLGRVIIAGWLLLFLCILGAVLGFFLYSKLVIGVTIDRQLSLINLAKAFVIESEAVNMADVRLEGNIPIQLPLNQVALPLRLKGTYLADIDIDTQIPINISALFNEDVVVETDFDIISDIELISSWLPKLPIKGQIPVRFEVPVSFTVPINTTMPFRYLGPVTFSLDQTIHPTVNQIISTNLKLNHQTTALIENRFRVSVDGEQAQIPIAIDDVTVSIPLETIKYTTKTAEKPSRIP
ncbi:MAG: hypothetical protein P1U57_02400 [Oleibacter sp.]|nr:hypothetical protein [Thalassolituus sp.]